MHLIINIRDLERIQIIDILSIELISQTGNCYLKYVYRFKQISFKYIYLSRLVTYINTLLTIEFNF